jgi:dTDP-4-amino-4,6-dideoxygalactose transaminase
MIKQKKYKEQYALLKKEYDQVYKDVMVKGYDFGGPLTKKLESKIQKITGRKYVWSTISGTAAIFAAIYALDLFGKKVAVAGYNYEACVSPFATLCHPVYFDCDENMLIDIDQIPNGCEALMIVNYNGNIVDYDRVRAKFKGKIITDCSQSTGARYKGKNDGFFGDVSTFAFGGQKPIGTRGVTGAIATNDKKIAHMIDCAINMGKSGERKELKAETQGFRGAGQDFQCGLVCAGLKYMDRWQKQREKIIKRVWKELEHLPLRFIKGGTHCDSSYYKIPMELDNRDDFIKFMKRNGVDTRLTYITNWSTNFRPGKRLAMAERLSNRTCDLPLSPFFTKSEVDKIIKTVKKWFATG